MRELAEEIRDRAMLLIRARGQLDSEAKNNSYRESLIFTTDLVMVRYIAAELSVRIKRGADKSGIQSWVLVLRDIGGVTDAYEIGDLEAVAADLRPLMVLDDLASI